MSNSLVRNSKVKKFEAGFIGLIMMLTSVTTIIFFAAPLGAGDPTSYIWTADEYGNPKNDFQPGEIVYIHGAGFSIGNTVDISITRPDGGVDVAPGGHFPSYLPVVDENTNFSYEYDLDGIQGNYTIVANDGINTAETTFTDAVYTVQTYSDPGYTTNKTFYNPGEPVYGKGVKKLSTSSHYLKLEYVDPSDNVVQTCLSSGKANIITCDYTLPGDAEKGEWDLKFYTHAWNSNPTTLKATKHFYVDVGYVENPELPGMCGIDMVLILDSSGSIDSGELNLMQDAFKDFVDVFLPLTPTEMAVVEFDFNATVLQDYTNDAGLLKSAIDSTVSGGVTNWDDGLAKAHSIFPNRYPDKPTMYIFASDGNPNHWGDGSGGWDENQAIVEAIEQANIIKGDGVRILTLGIGDELDDQRLKAISSDDAYYDVAGFEDLADVLYELVIELCGGTIIVKKLIDGVNASDWLFTAEVISGGTVTPTSDYTDENGFIVFDVQLDNGVTTAYVNVIETPVDGYMLADATATDRCTGSEVGTPGPNGIYDIPVEKVCIYYCEFINTETPPPETTKEYGSPKCIVGEDTYITSHTPIYLNTTSYVGCYTIYYRIGYAGDWTPWQEGADSSNVIFTLDGLVAEIGGSWNDDCEHIIEYYAVDCVGKIEETHEQTFHVDNIGPPAVVKEVGEPQHVDSVGRNFVTTNTKIWLNASDPGSDCEVPGSKIRYIIRWDSDGDGIVDTEVANKTVDSNKASFTFVQGCKHELEYWAVDCLGNEGEHTTQEHFVDIECPPSGEWEFIGPHYEKGGKDYITHETIKRITICDEGCNVGGAGVAEIEYELSDPYGHTVTGTVRDGLDDSRTNSWYEVTGDNDPATGCVSIDISILQDCIHVIKHRGVDYLGNKCDWVTQEVRVDTNPPDVDKIVGDPSCEISPGVFCVTKDTPITITATDDEIICDVGSVDLTIGIFYNGVWKYNDYHIDDGPLEVTFTFEGEGMGGDCIHYVTYTAVDDLGNLLAEDNETFYVTSQGPKIFMEVGDPNCTDCGMGENEYCINSSTPIYIDVETPASGCFCPGLTVQYSTDEGATWETLSSWPITWYFNEPCRHTLDVRAFDCLGEMVYANGIFWVDIYGPESLEDYKTVGEPNARLEDDPMGHHQWLVFKGTEIDFTVPPDVGCCPCTDVKIEYRIWYLGQWSEWTEYTESITFSEGCMHYLEARASDCLGNYGEIDNETFWVCGSGGYGDPIEIVSPVNGSTENSEIVEVIIHAYDDITPWPELDVYLWIPGGRRDAPYLYYDVEPLEGEEDYYVAYVPIYNYQDGAQITLKAGAFDEHGNYAESLPVTFTVDSTVKWDQWMQYGWNPLPLSGGMPPGLECNESLERVLSSVYDSYDWVFHYDLDEGWISYYTGRTSNELQEVEGGKSYWVHITKSNGIRYYIAMPEVEIQNPEDQAFISDEFPDEINGYAWDSQTGVTEVEIILYYMDEGDVEHYWNGAEWIDTLFYLPCDLESHLEHYIQEWSYDCSEVDWIDEMTYYVYAIAYDGFECYAIDDISFFINLTKYDITGTITYEGEEEGYIFVELVDPSGSELVTYVFLLEPGPYTLSAPNGTYYVAAFMDLNMDTYFDDGIEPAGLAINKDYYGGDSPDQIVVSGDDWNNVDIILYDPPPPE